MDRVMLARSTSPPPTPAASSAGASSPAVPVNVGSMDCTGFSHGPKAGTSSGAGSFLPWTSSMSVGGPAPGSSQLSCRPWERADLLKRLATYRPANWSGKPKVASSLACARRGWINVDVDTIACETCGAHLTFTMSSFWTNDEAQSASEAFVEQLDTGHRSTCPWKGNSCSESLAQFPPTPPSALIGGYNDRCDALLQFSALPVISGFAIERMKLSRGPQIERILTQLYPVIISEFSGRTDNMPGAELSREEAASVYYQAQRVLSLCGWEPRLVPNVVDCEEHSAQSARNACSAGPAPGQFKLACDPGPSMLLFSRSAQLEKREISKKKISISESRCSPASAVLDCSLCGATVRICSFVTVHRPSRFVSSLNEPPESSKKLVLTRGISAASGIDGWCTVDTMGRENLEGRDEAEEAVEGKSHSNVGMDLNWTIARGPLHADFGAPAVTVPLEDPMQDRDPMLRQPAGSEVGDRAASYESRGPRTRKHSMDEGGSTVDRPLGRLQHADSVEGTVVDRDADEVNDGSQCSGGPSKRTRTMESLAADRVSYFKDVSYPGPSHSAAFEIDFEVEGLNHCKRSTIERSLHEGNQQRIGGQSWRDSTRESSVIAMDTCYHSLQENSMESVENFPADDDDVHGPLPSIDKNTEVNEMSELNFSIQAQQSTCQQPESGRDAGETGLSTSDEGDGILNGENATFEARGGFSLAISGGSVGMGASHEAEIHGADVSVHRTESIVGEADLVAEVTENQGQTGESVPDRGLMGEFVPEEVEREDVHGDSHDMMMPHSVGREYIGSKIGVSIEGESMESGQKSSRTVDHEDGDQPTLTHNGTTLGSDYEVSKEEVTNVGKGYAAVDNVNAGSPCDGVDRTERQLNKGILLKHEALEFDPIQQHHHFCPWVNGNVAAAGCSNSGAMALCGWQLTVDALDAYHTQGHVPAATMESESAASLYKDDHLASVHKMLGRHSMTKNCGHS
uniref:TSA: Wollemia nobilis Ref_Wollemi_Transcript_12909_3387 transcribed RNA sequence n=1 Tax=Wollemia nobilis TaxID=56998 RepID=A0A0C9S5D3_9CONI